MITNYEAIVQDQLTSSALPGKVRVRYPRGATTVLSVDTNGVVSIKDDTSDGSYEAASVLSNGNLLYLADRVDSIGTIVLGAALIPLP